MRRWREGEREQKEMVRGDMICIAGNITNRIIVRIIWRGDTRTIGHSNTESL